MRTLPLLAALLASCATAPESASPPPEGPLVEIREAVVCAKPPSRTLITVPRDGRAERVVFDSLDFDIEKTRSSREKMDMTPKDTGTLFGLVADSGWQSLPENASETSTPPACSGFLMIKTAGGARSLHYATDRKSAKLAALIKGIDEILARGTWTRVVYDWEKQR